MSYQPEPDTYYIQVQSVKDSHIVITWQTTKNNDLKTIKIACVYSCDVVIWQISNYLYLGPNLLQKKKQFKLT